MYYYRTNNTDQLIDIGLKSIFVKYKALINKD